MQVGYVLHSFKSCSRNQSCPLENKFPVETYTFYLLPNFPHVLKLFRNCSANSSGGLMINSDCSSFCRK
jgi:hypothetical protein